MPQYPQLSTSNNNNQCSRNGLIFIEIQTKKTYFGTFVARTEQSTFIPDFFHPNINNAHCFWNRDGRSIQKGCSL